MIRELFPGMWHLDDYDAVKEFTRRIRDIDQRPEPVKKYQIAELGEFLTAVDTTTNEVLDHGFLITEKDETQPSPLRGRFRN